MRRLIYLGALALVLVALIAPSAGATGLQTTTTTVSIQDFFFSPANVSVSEPGTTVTWVRGQRPHTVTSDDGQFDSGVLMPGDSYTVMFKGQGTITYHCAIHPSMTGSVSVGTPAMGAGGGGQPMGPSLWVGQPMGGQPMGGQPMGGGY